MSEFGSQRDQRIAGILRETAAEIGIGIRKPLLLGGRPLSLDAAMSPDALLPVLVLEGAGHCWLALGLPLMPAFTPSDGPMKVAVRSFGPAPASVVLACVAYTLKQIETDRGFDLDPLVESWGAACDKAVRRHRASVEETAADIPITEITDGLSWDTETDLYSQDGPFEEEP